ncbi:MAG: prepilin-type N-terminal cleavage/methylation domain-containing protein [Halomonas sp.]|nr:prepilin-type N-terminal cleavage/methylation domain-containing protein [Halomonas sp.]MDP3535340.1 prepilin-type N-terminal cleavage/methylation domain-containing protein [Halomonas sp.]
MKHQQGFSLIEVLIALVVLSFGLVGMAAMQLKALQNATHGYQRSVVTLAAVDAQELFWAELAQGAVCSDMVANVESEWDKYWFGDGSETPIRGFSGEIKPNAAISCEFSIKITSASGSEDYEHTFRLPDPEES